MKNFIINEEKRKLIIKCLSEIPAKLSFDSIKILLELQEVQEVKEDKAAFKDD